MPNSLGPELRRTREARQLSMARLAKTAGVAPSTVYRTETSRTVPDTDTIERLDRALKAEGRLVAAAAGLLDSKHNEAVTGKVIPAAVSKSGYQSGQAGAPSPTLGFPRSESEANTNGQEAGVTDWWGYLDGELSTLPPEDQRAARIKIRRFADQVIERFHKGVAKRGPRDVQHRAAKAR